MAAILGLSFELPFWPGGTSASIANFPLNAANDAMEFIFQVPENTTIVDVGFRQGVITGTSPVYKASLQGVADGVPDGTILGGGSPASVTFTPVSGGNNTWQWKALDNAIAVTRGQWVAMVIARDSGTIDASNNCSFAATSSITPIPGGSPYAIQNDAGSRAKQTVTAAFGFRSSTRAYGLPISAAISTTFTSNSTPDERGNRINIPTSWCSNYKIAGAAIYGTMNAATTYDVTLHDGTNVLQAITVDSDNDQNSTGARRRVILFDESTLSTLSAGVDYYLTAKPNGATSISVIGMTVALSADLDAYLGGSAVCAAATRTDGGAFSVDTSSRYAVNPILADITVPNAASGVSYSRVFAGL